MKILIAGDSWGCGEWAIADEDLGIKYGVLHSGLEQYFLDFGYQVTNVSLPGASNTQSTTLLKDAVAADHYDYIFWFQTDPIRDYFRFPFKYEAAKLWYTVDDILHDQDVLLDKTYLFLSEIPATIHCIGGCSKLEVDKLSKYENLVAFIPSTIEFLVPTRTHHPLHFSDWLDYIPKHFEDFDRLVRLKHQCDLLFTDDALQECFYPDGWHANRLGHKKMFDYIIDYFKLDKKF